MLPPVLLLIAFGVADPPCELVGASLGDPVPWFFGQRVALSGSTVLVGAGPGLSYVFTEESGRWVEQAQLRYTNTGELGLSGDTAFIGAGGSDDVALNAGAVWVFDRAGEEWSRSQLTASDALPGDAFGSAVAIEGDRACVGAAGKAAVYVYERVDGAWCETSQLVPEGGPVGFGYGSTVALSGDTILVGAVLTDTVHVFVERGGLWSQQATLYADPPFATEGPVQVDVCGDTAIVATRYRGARIYVRHGETWSEEARLTDPGTGGFGDDAAICGDVAVVGAALDFGITSEATVFVRSSGTWSALGRSEGLGALNVAVAVDGQRIVHADTGPPSLPGQASVIDLPPYVAPSVVPRNGGTNPESYAVTPTYVGQEMSLSVDVSLTGHEMALVIGFDSPFRLTLGGGQTLLCLDLLGSGGELLNTGFHPGPVAEIDIAVPSDLALAGFTVCTQAIHAFGVVPFALSNAQDIVIGACL